MNSFSSLSSGVSPSASFRSGRGVTAVLGPTNTGKTHLAIERMLAQPSGMIGLPLRLLAREVYQRVVDRMGRDAVALITGEEKIMPPGARFQICTVEAMPPVVDVDFLAIDEVQLATTLNRGHVFTDRLLNLRGRYETMLMGASTIRPALEALLPGINIITRPRMSQLHYAGQKKITRLPRRSAIVAFSADEVYAIAELIRRQRGAAAVVLGSLSPRTRNAQVALYQSGDVDFLVATDAIGMGLNLDVDHVAFAQDTKFDGYSKRRLKAAEFSQIAGRAGRHVNDGTFGVTGNANPFEDELVQRLEAHEFVPDKVLQWRNRDLSFDSIEALIASLDQGSHNPHLVKAPLATDQQAFALMAGQQAIRDQTRHSKDVALLWQVAQIPDYRKIAPANHADMLATIYHNIMDYGAIDENWFANQVRQTDVVSGDIDALSNRIAHIRTWTYISHRADWLKDPLHWQSQTRAIEDRLSDALHERLTKRFVDRRTSVLMKRLRENTMLEAEISTNGTVMVEGHHVGELSGFRFTADPAADGPDAKAAKAAAQKALASEIEARAERLGAAPNSDIILESDGTMRWVGAPVGRIVAGESVLKPKLILLADEQLTGPARDKVAARLERWLNHHIETFLKPLQDLEDNESLEGMARGVAYRILENLGTVDRRSIASDIHGLDQEQRGTLRRKGVRFGAYHVFVPALLKPAPAALICLLWSLKEDKMEAEGRAQIIQGLAAGRTSMAVDATFEEIFYRLAGFRVLGKKAVRVDILERLADILRPAIAWRPAGDKTPPRPEGAWDSNAFTVTTGMLSILGASHDDMADILRGLGYRSNSILETEINARFAEWDHKGAEADSEKPVETDAKEANEGVEQGQENAQTAPATMSETVEPDLAANEKAKESAAEENPVEESPAKESAAKENIVEEKYIYVWRFHKEGKSANRSARPDHSGGTGRSGQKQHSNKSTGPNRGKAKFANKSRPDGAQKSNKPHFAGKKRADNKPIDPDNPFAALMALKEGMKKKG